MSANHVAASGEELIGMFTDFEVAKKRGVGGVSANFVVAMKRIHRMSIDLAAASGWEVRGVSANFVASGREGKRGRGVLSFRKFHGCLWGKVCL